MVSKDLVSFAKCSNTSCVALVIRTSFLATSMSLTVLPTSSHVPFRWPSMSTTRQPTVAKTCFIPEEASRDETIRTPSKRSDGSGMKSRDVSSANNVHELRFDAIAKYSTLSIT